METLHLHCRNHCCSHVFLMCSDGKFVGIPASCLVCWLLIWIWRTTWHDNNGGLAFKAPCSGTHRKPFQWHWVDDKCSISGVSGTLNCLQSFFFLSFFHSFFLSLLWHGNSDEGFELQWTAQCMKLLLLQINVFLEHVCSTMPLAGSSGLCNCL